MEVWERIERAKQEARNKPEAQIKRLKKDIEELQLEVNRLNKTMKEIEFDEKVKKNVGILKKVRQFLKLYEELDNINSMIDCNDVCQHNYAITESLIAEKKCPFAHLCAFFQDREILNLDLLDKLIEEGEKSEEVS